MFESDGYSACPNPPHVVEIEKNPVEGILEPQFSPPVFEVVHRARKAFNSGVTRPYEFRKQQLTQLRKLCTESGNELAAALKADLHKGHFESFVCEIEIIIAEIDYALRNLRQWMKPEQAAKTTTSLFDSISIVPDPWGVALIISSWNYPIHLTLMPLVGAIAGGNCVVIKPSELAPACSKILCKLIPQYLDVYCFPVVEGGPKEAESLLNEKFDYIFYTGSSQVGRLVYSAASRYFTPVTLEMGGKSPVFLDGSCNLRLATERILWGKMTNSGQTCIAPDYIICTSEIQEKFIEMVKEIISQFYPSGSRVTDDYGRIINQKHFKRLTRLMQEGDIVVGGDTDESDLYISPTVISNVKDTHQIMKEEIFGPILPIITVNSSKDALNFILQRDPPLTCYVFSTRSEVQKAFISTIPAGSVCINETCSIIIVNSLPFGGIGPSGIGSYHGKHSFDTFTHKKSVLVKSYNYISDTIIRLRYPPYTSWKQNMISLAIGFPLPGVPWRFLIFLTGLVSGILATTAFFWFALGDRT